MKTIMNKLRYTLLLGFMALAAGAPMNALTLDVCNGSQTNQYVPLDAYNLDYYNQVSQMIYPSSMLTNMQGNLITKLTFYANNNITLSSGSFTIKMGTTTNSNYSSATRITSNMTTVATGNIANCISGSQFVITLDTPFEYNGNNLVIDVQFTKAGQGVWQTLSFLGASQTNASIYGENQNSTPTSFTRLSFLPRLTFDYIQPAPTIMATPTQLNFETQPDQSQSQTVTVTGFYLSTGITATLNDPDNVYSLNTTNLSNGGNLLVTYSSSTTGIHSATVTLSSTGADPVTINLKGSCVNTETICDGTGTDEHLPIWGYNYDNKQINQMIYPKSELTSLVGTKITSMTFYSPHLYFSGGAFTVKVGETSQASFSSAVRNTADLTATVVTGMAAPTAGGTELTITFAAPYEYNGGNLLVDFEVTTKGAWGGTRTSFYGETQSGAGFHSYGSSINSTTGVYGSASVDNFLPKVKFAYVGGTPITQGTVSPSNVDFGAKNIGGTYTATVTVRNTGNQPFTPIIDATGLPQGITVSPTTIGQMNGGGTQNLTVTFTPTAEQSYSGSFTVTIPVPNDNDIVVTVTVTGSGFYANRLTSNTTAEIPVYKSEAKADGTYIFSKNDVDGDINRTLSYGNGNVNVEVLVKDEEPVTSYDLRHKVGSANWASVATATQDASNPKVYAYNNETFTIPNDATEMWIPMTDAGVDASSTIYYVPVTYANGIVTQGNTYGAPQVQATTDPVSFNVAISGWKSAQGVGAHWTQTVGDEEMDYCIYMPLITVSDVSPAFTESRVPYKFRAWLTECTNDVVLYNYQRVPNTNDPNHSHIEGDTPLTLPKYLGELSSDFELTGSGPYIIGDDPYDENAPRPDGDVQPLNTFAAPSVLPDGAKFTIVVRAYYYQVPETRGALMLRDGEGAPADGYGYGEGSGEGQGGSFMTAVNDVYTDREVVDVKYVNIQGMQSDKPFDGINIVVTRYSDGSTSTTKVVR